MKIFVTGATGFIGKEFIKELLRRLPPVGTVYILSRKGVKWPDARVITLTGDLDSIGKFRQEALSADYFFHLAANPTFGSAVDYDRVNYLPTKCIVDMLAESRALKNLVFLSTIGAMDRHPSDRCAAPLTTNSIPSPTSAYGRSKLKAEEYIRASGLPFTIIRPAWVYGKDMRGNSHVNKFVSMVYQGTPLAKVHFPGKVSLIHVEDLARALVRVIGNPVALNRTYIAETESLALGEILGIIYEKIKGRKPRQLRLPSFRALIGRIHHKIPLAVANLFVDYLTARDEHFQSDFSLGQTKKFSQSVDDVISTNIHTSGWWVITGANSGIGLALARRLDREGKSLVLVDKETDRVEPLRTRHVIISADLSRLEDLQDVAEKTRHFKIFCLVNNAGVGLRRSLAEITVDEAEEMINVNARAPVVLTKLLLDNLIRDESVIVNVASSIAYNPLPYMAMYSATKAFLANWSESISYELKGTNRVVTFSPAGTRTRFQERAGVKVSPGGKDLLDPEKVADRLIRSVYGGKAVVVVGFRARLLLAISRLLPRQSNITLWGKMFEKYR